MLRSRFDLPAVKDALKLPGLAAGKVKHASRNQPVPSESQAALSCRDCSAKEHWLKCLNWGCVMETQLHANRKV